MTRPTMVASVASWALSCLALPAAGLPTVPEGRGVAEISAQARPGDATALVGLCRTRIGRDDAESAAAAGRRAVALDPGNTEAALCLGAALVMLERYAEALPPLERVLARRPDNPDALYALAVAYGALHDPRAEHMHERLAAVRPDDIDVRLGLIEYLWAHAKAPRGNEQMGHLLGTAPGRPDLHIKYALELLRQRQFRTAARQLDEARAAGAAPYQVAYLLGTAWWEAGEVDRALASFETAIAIDPTAVPARHDIGRLLLWSGRPEAAVPHLEQAAAARPSSVGARDDPEALQGSAAIRFDLGRSYEALGRLDRAEHAYREALALEPSLSPLHYALGRLLKRMGRDVEAAKALREYRRLYDAEQQRRFDEKSRRAELALARVELRAGNAPAALARFERLGDTPEALIGRADALSRLDRRDEAIRLLERARVLAPDDPRVTYLLARERAAAEGRPIRR